MLINSQGFTSLLQNICYPLKVSKKKKSLTNDKKTPWNLKNAESFKRNGTEKTEEGDDQKFPL